jgi:NADH dehydrogenase
MREGQLIGKNVAAAVMGGAPQTFRYRGLGQFVSLGHQNAVMEAPGGLKLSGFPAWWMWRTYYLGRLPGLSRKVRVALDWTLDLVFGRDITQLPLSRGERVGRFHFEAGDVIVSQGDPAQLFYVIAEGEVEIVREGTDGGEQPVARLGAGEYFGEMALLGGSGKRSATVRALTPVNLLTLARDDFTLLASCWSSLREHLQEGMKGKS